MATYFKVSKNRQTPDEERVTKSGPSKTETARANAEASAQRQEQIQQRTRDLTAQARQGGSDVGLSWGVRPKNSSSAVSGATSALQQAADVLAQGQQAAGNAWNQYDTGKIGTQQQALDMMKLGSGLWNESQYQGMKDAYARGNQTIANQWFPGATRDANGVWWQDGQRLYDMDFTGGQNGSPALTDAAVGMQKLQKNGPQSGAGGYAGQYGPQVAQSFSGEPYTIGSEAGLDFLYNGAVGSHIVGGDGSLWQKDQTGMVTITKDGKTYRIQGAATGQPEMPEITPFEQTEIGQKAIQIQDDLWNRLGSYPAFSYDPMTDPLYQQYADSYTRSGQRAMTDVLGQLAARTGGMASSYAGAMAQQTYDSYMADLANKVPELYQLAYGMYADDYNRLADRYGLAASRNREDYNRWADQYTRDYNAYRDQVGDRQWAIGNAQNQRQLDYENYVNADNTAYNRDQAAKEWDYQVGKDEREWQHTLEREAIEDQRYAQQYEDARKDARISQLLSLVQTGYRPTAADVQGTGWTAQQLIDLANWVRTSQSKYY